MSALADRVSTLLESARLRGVTLGVAAREAGISAGQLAGVMGARPDLAAAWGRLRAEQVAPPHQRSAWAPGPPTAILPNGRRHNGAAQCALATCEYARGSNREFCPRHVAIARAFWRDLAADLRNGRIDDADYPKPGE